MIPTVATLIIVAAIIVVAIVHSIRTRDYEPEKKPVADERMTAEEAGELYSDGELTTKAGYLHYTLTEAYEAGDGTTGPFVGYVRPDAQHDGTLIIYDSNDDIRGKVEAQSEYYAALLNRRHANCYGFVAKDDADGCGYHGEVCLRKI